MRGMRGRRGRFADELGECHSGESGGWDQRGEHPEQQGGSGGDAHLDQLPAHRFFRAAAAAARKGEVGLARPSDGRDRKHYDHIRRHEQISDRQAIAS